MPSPASPASPRRVPLVIAALAVGVLTAACGASGASDDVRDVPTKTTRKPDGRPDLSGFPSARTTGPKPGTQLRVVGETTVKKAGEVVEGVEIHGKLNIEADDVVVRNVRVVGQGDWAIIQRQGVSGADISDVEIMGDGTTKVDTAVLNQGGQISVRRANIHTVSNGIVTDHGVIEDCYLHDFKEFPGDHVDAIQIGGSPMKGLSLTVRHNTVFNQVAETSAIIIGQDFSRTHDVLIQNNLLAGGGYTIYGGEGKFGVPTDIRIVDNIFSRRFFPKGGSFGPVAYYTDKGKGNAFTGNIWEDGKPL
ncbi:hypothetical protein [Sphaerisporangium fuscum]|uniref:hypothetical protein n=1 Tax=Sphaerisporangium fuscum TaxID=2835868 RepID=UPI001BDD1202|nr:hypothetical protein [Sphaerisporangium fuscum]